MELPKPSDPHRKLEKFAGKWAGEETLRTTSPGSSTIVYTTRITRGAGIDRKNSMIR